MKRNLILSIGVLLFSSLSCVMAFAMGSERAPVTYTVSGVRAEFLFEAMNKFEYVEGLEGTADCAMGTCMTQMSYTSCTKSFDQMEIDPGVLTEPFLTCSIQSTDPRRGSLNVSYRDNKGVSQLRRALVEITGKESIVDNTKSVSVKSITCEAASVNREMNSLGTESRFECKIVR